MLSITSVLIPKSFWDIPLYVADNSPLSSTTPHVTPLKLNSGIPLLIFFIISFKSVVFPKPGGEIISVFHTVFSFNSSSLSVKCHFFIQT